MNLTVKGRKKLYLFDQNCVDNAVLTWSADDACLSEVGCDYCALGHEVTADVVRVCCVLCNGENLDLLDLSGLGVAEVCELTAECANLGVSSGGADGLDFVLSKDSVCCRSSDLGSSDNSA